MVFRLIKGCLFSTESVVGDGSTDTLTKKEQIIVDRSHRTEEDSLASDYSKAVLLESYATKAQWDAVIRLVSSSCVDDWLDSPVPLSSSSDQSSSPQAFPLQMTQTPLHLALHHGAPVHVVDSLIQILKENMDVHAPEEMQDEDGRTPLHVAVAAGCEEAVAQRLLAGDNLVMPAVLRDTAGQTPLHAACASPVLRRKKSAVWKANQFAMDHWHKRKVIDLLVEQYPEACTLTDDHNKTPLAYAIANKLQKHTVHELKDTAEAWAPTIAEPSENHSRDDLESLANSDVPMVVPSEPGSTCRVLLTKESIARLDKLLQEDWKSDEDKDVSTLGDDDCADDLPEDQDA